MEDDGKADVEDEVSYEEDADADYIEIKYSGFRPDDAECKHVDDKGAISASKVFSNQFVVLHSHSMNFQAGKDKIDCSTNDVNNVGITVGSLSKH